MSSRRFLQISGPTNTPGRVLRATAAPTIDHRRPAFRLLTGKTPRTMAPGAEVEVRLYGEVETTVRFVRWSNLCNDAGGLAIGSGPGV